MEHLLFRLYGPMAAWGDIAVGERRPTSRQPSKSAIMGLLAAALGVRRDQEAELRTLTKEFGVAVRLDAPGSLLRDYHTTQVAPGRAIPYTRSDQLKGELTTILSQRDYRVDASCTIAVWACTPTPGYPLSQVLQALRHPAFVLYLGRKSCPLALPLQPQLVAASTLEEAFLKGRFSDLHLDGLDRESRVEVMWEQHPEPGFQPEMVYTRRDSPSNRRQWQFDEREEYHGFTTREAAS